MSLDTTTSYLIVVGLVLVTFLVIITGLLFLQLTIIRVRLRNEEQPSTFAKVARGYMNKPLPQLPLSPVVDTFRKKRNSQARRVLMEDDNERGNEPISPLFAMRNKNLIRRTREFPDLPLRHISTSKPTFTVSPGHYTGDTLRTYTPPSQNRGPRGAEQQEVTLGLDQGSVKTPTRASRSMTNRPRPNVDVIPEEHDGPKDTAGAAMSLQPSPTVGMI